uniref:Predicted protein n=1 Tax=Hordeum vulgare subsp. vulgare TaxID=112509 RepID=F2E095_HORVV|nr:predicted protein [Hordeum vulgare subsp. vulgare]
MRLVAVLVLATLCVAAVPATHGHSHPSHKQGKSHGRLKDWMGRGLTAGGTATDPTTPAGLVDRFLVEAKISPDNLPKQTDPDVPLPNRHMYTWYTRGGTRVTMIVDDTKRFDFDLSHPPPFETAGVNMVYYARRLDQQLLADARLWIKEYGYESAQKRLRELKGPRAILNPKSNANHFAPVLDTQGNRKHRDLLPSSPQRINLRIVFVSDNLVASHAQIAHALKGSLNIVVFKLHATHLKQVWPELKGHAPALPLSSSSASSASRSAASSSGPVSASSSEPSTADKLAYLHKKWRDSIHAQGGKSKGKTKGKEHSEETSLLSGSSSNSTSSASDGSSSSGSSSSSSSSSPSGSSLTKL